MSHPLADITTVRQIEHYQTLLWQGVAEGQLDEAAATELAEAANTKRTVLLEARESRLPPARSYFPTRLLSGQSRSQAAIGPRCSSRWARKRRLGDMAALPPHMRDSFTEGERAVLYIVTADCRHHNRTQCVTSRTPHASGGHCGATAMARKTSDQCDVYHLPALAILAVKISAKSRP
jgi:hypothetical protein